MGKKLIIKGADFSEVAVEIEEVHTNRELLTTNGSYSVSRNTPKTLELSSSENWRTAILELHNNMYIENATAMRGEDKGNPNFPKDVPEIIFLSGDSIEDYIQDSEVYVLGQSGAFGTFTGILEAPEGATHVIINTIVNNGGDLNAVISWLE